MLADRPDGAEGTLEHLLERVLALRIFQGHLAGDHVVEDAAEEIDVGSWISLGAAAGALERRVVDGALAVHAVLALSPSMVASPKSTSLAVPEFEIRMFVALMSRWVTPCSCENLRPCARPSMQRQGLAILERACGA